MASESREASVALRQPVAHFSLVALPLGFPASPLADVAQQQAHSTAPQLPRDALAFALAAAPQRCERALQRDAAVRSVEDFLPAAQQPAVAFAPEAVPLAAASSCLPA